MEMVLPGEKGLKNQSALMPKLSEWEPYPYRYVFLNLLEPLVTSRFCNVSEILGHIALLQCLGGHPDYILLAAKEGLSAQCKKDTRHIK